MKALKNLHFSLKSNRRSLLLTPYLLNTNNTYDRYVSPYKPFYCLKSKQFAEVMFKDRQATRKLSTGIPGNMGFDHYGIVVPNAKEATEFFMDVFDADFDWEVSRDPTPTFGERGWDKVFHCHPDCYLKEVVFIKCGDNELTQYIEFFEFVSPDQKPFDYNAQNKWLKSSDTGNSYVTFTVRDLDAAIDHIKEKSSKKWDVKVVHEKPIKNIIRGEEVLSNYIVTPWGQWIELTCYQKRKDLTKPIRVQRKDDSKTGLLKERYVGKSITELPTPSFLIDFDVMDHNIDIMKKRIKQDRNLSWVLPSKMHKCPKLANYLLEKTGANGILCLTLNETEKYIHSREPSIVENTLYFANQVTTSDQLQRISLAAKEVSNLRVTVDNKTYIKELAKAVESWEITTPIEVLIEVNIGHNRCGVNSPEEALELAKLIKQISQNKGALVFTGICGYEGHTPVMPPQAKLAETKRGHSFMKTVKDHLEKHGFEVKLVSAGGSSNYMQALEVGIVNELQAGGGLVCDSLYYHKAGLSEFGHKIASSMLTTILSSPKDGSRFIADAGFKTIGLHPHSDLPYIKTNFVSNDNNDSFYCSGVSSEQIRFMKKEGSDSGALPGFSYGDKVELNIGYTDAMGFLNRQIFVIRKGICEDIYETFSETTWI